MTFTIKSARWGNEERTAAILDTGECAFVAISVKDTPEEWEAFLKWQDSNKVDPAAVSEDKPRFSSSEKIAALEARLAQIEDQLKPKV